MNAKNPPNLLQKAVSLHQAGQMAEAERAYQDVLAVDNKHGEALRLLGTLYVQSNKLTEAVQHLERALAVLPNHPDLLNVLGVTLYKLNRTNDAITYYKRADVIAPNNESILTNLGNALRKAGRSEEAASTYQHLVALNSKQTGLKLNLGTIFHDMGKWDKAMQQYEDVLKIDPASIDAAINRAGILMEMDRPEEARTNYQKALTHNPQSEDARWGHSLAALALGDYGEGWKLYESRFNRDAMREALLFQEARWDGSALNGKRLLIWAEQGLGDMLQFIRYAALCKEKGGAIIVQCAQPLVRLLQNCPYIDRVLTKATAADFDYQIPVMSLPYIFDTTLNTIPNKVPYLFVSDEARHKWASRFANVGGFKVGLVWSGNPRKHLIEAHVTDRQRSMSIALMKPLLNIEGCHFYNLQKGEAAAEIAVNDLQSKLIDYMSDVDDFMDTAAIIENLDLVISVDTSVVHLAGGLGKPVWVLSRFAGCWRWLRNQETNPWYPSARVFSPPTQGDWNSCMDKVRNALINAV